VVFPSTRWLALLALLEFIALFAAFCGAAQLRFLADQQAIASYIGDLAPRALLFSGVMILALAAMGLYHSHSRERLVGQLGRTLAAFAAGGLALMAGFYVVRQGYVGRGVLALALAIGMVMVLLVRYLFTAVVNQNAFKRRVLVLGSGQRANLLVERMRRAADRRGFDLLGFFPVDGEEMLVPREQRLDPAMGLAAMAESLDVDEIVISMDERRGRLPMPELIECRLGGVAVIDLATFFERESGKVKVGLIDPSWLVFSDGFDTSTGRQLAKRVFDVAVSLVVMVLASPIMLITAIAIMLESGWRQPILYSQERVGARESTFRVHKFRSMRTDAEKDGVARWATANDDRVTRVGRLIRKLRIDELPQIFNVLRGDMSFVGPRPERPQFVAELAAKLPYYRLRHRVKPGITGWAQMRYPYGASVQDAVEKLKFDLYYVKNHSLLFDTMILLQTVEVVVFGKGGR
jgi:sugar transferase (PEP-CTERM system associated)